MLSVDGSTNSFGISACGAKMIQFPIVVYRVVTTSNNHDKCFICSDSFLMMYDYPIIME